MVTNFNDYFKDNDDDEHFEYQYRDDMIAQFKQDFFNKSFSHQDQDKRETKLQKILNFGLIMSSLMRERQYQKMFMIMIITMMEWVFTFGSKVRS